jgi:hypothetical protein
VEPVRLILKHACLISGKSVDIRSRVALRARYITPYNF